MLSAELFETFTWDDTLTGKTYIFDVTKAIAIAERELGEDGIRVTAVAPLADLIDQGCGDIDEAKMLALRIEDLGRPILSAKHPDADNPLIDPATEILIDGWHRIEMARRYEVADLLIWPLTSEQTNRILVSTAPSVSVTLHL